MDKVLLRRTRPCYGMARKPRFNGGWMTIRQEVDDAATLKVADDGAIAPAMLPREVVNADDGGR